MTESPASSGIDKLRIILEDRVNPGRMTISRTFGAEVQLIEEAYTNITMKKYPNDCSDNCKRIIRNKSSRLMVGTWNYFINRSGKGR